LPRLYLAEGVAAVLEIKSDLLGEWDAMKSTVKRLSELKRDLEGGFFDHEKPTRIPFLPVGFEGWRDLSTLQQKALEPGIDGILVINNGPFYCDKKWHKIWAMPSNSAPWALWNFVCCMHGFLNQTKATFVRPFHYAGMPPTGEAKT
jgi:hypothetical protein